ncbi:MAG: SPOR domain-containing protein, partial [Rhodanobacteraceae bacterium]
MFVRLLFLLLLALNVGAGAWLLFGRAPAASFPPATDPGVPELRLWSERTKAMGRAGSAASAMSLAPSVASTAPPLASDSCMTLGPFMTTVDMRAAMQTLSPHVARIQYREEQVSRSHGYWVYLPAAASREAALDDARQLSAKDIHDYYVVTAGDSQNTISLGLFNDEGNANKRVATLLEKGFPAKVEQR